VALLPRRSLLQRPDARGKLKPVAANVDQIIVVVAIPPAETIARGATLIDTYVLDRYLVAAAAAEIDTYVVANKADLLHEDTRAQAEAIIAEYARLCSGAVLVSNKTGEGMPDLTQHLTGHTSAFVGPSGVGKSSLIDHFLPDRQLRIGAVAASTGLGRHTTTSAALYHFPAGGHLIDSPGVREFGLWNMTPQQVAAAFCEFALHTRQCRFADCRHVEEPACAVRDAVARGEISARRYDNYTRILRSMDQLR
jgi:ribosome biogenesis GTPase